MKVLGFNKQSMALLLIALAASVLSVSHAQARRTGWQCPGNVYTNDQALVKKLGNCKELDVSLTVMPSKPGGQVRSTGGSSTSTAKPANSSSMYVGSPEQQNRDTDARKLIEAELSKKQSELAMLQGQYNNGEPARLASEVRDEEAYQARITSMSREIEKKVSEIASIQSEIARFR